MIILSHPLLPAVIPVSGDMVSSVMIENPKILRNIIEELYAQVSGEDGDWQMTENFKSLLISKSVELILTPFGLDFGQRKIMTKIYSDLEKLSVEPEWFERTTEFRMQTQAYLQDLLLQYSVALTWDDMISTTALTKAANVQVDTEEMSCLDKILAYLRLFSELRLAKVFVFVNLKSFLTQEELLLLYREARLYKYALLCLENHQHDKIEDYEKILLLDEDLCEIINELN